MRLGTALVLGLPMSNEHSINPGGSIGPEPLTYGELRVLVIERLVRGDASEPIGGDDADPKNAVNAMVKRKSAAKTAINLFMSANDLVDASPVGLEMTGPGYDAALRTLGDCTSISEAKRKSAKAKLNSFIREWAIQEISARNEIFANETFPERLSRIMQLRGMGCRELSAAISRGGNPVRHDVVQAWRSGKRTPAGEASFGRVSAMEQALQVPPGTLRSSLPRVAFRADSVPFGGTRGEQRKYSFFLDGVPVSQREEAIAWIEQNVFRAPVEDFDENGDLRREPYALALRDEKPGRLRVASAVLTEEVRAIVAHKTAVLVEPGLNRNTAWGPYAAEKCVGDLMRFMGSLAELGAPVADLRLSALLSPTALHAHVEWFRDRRGAYTHTIFTTLWTIGTIIHPKTGFVAQRPELFGRIPLIPNITQPHEVARADADWLQACAEAFQETRKICDQLKDKVEQGRNPFQAILPVLDAELPVNEYYKIVHEIRRQMPDRTYPSAWAEVQRALFIFRLGIERAFRQRNLREMVLRLPGDSPRKAAWLTRNRVMELGFNDDGVLVIRAPRTAFKNARSSVVKGMDPDRPMVLQDNDGLYAEFQSYLEAREVLLRGHPDPGTLFVKNMGTRAEDPCMGQEAFYNAFVAAVRRYGIRNPFNGRGAIEGLRPHGPHAGFRDVVATHILKTGGGVSIAADALLDSEEMIRAHYGRYLPQDRIKAASNFVAKTLYGGKP